MYLEPSKAGHLILCQSEELGRNVLVFLIVCSDIFFGYFPHFWLVHLAVITSIVTKHSHQFHAHQNHWCWYVCLMMIIIFFPRFSPIVTGDKVSQNRMLVCQALITHRCWSTLFWGFLLNLDLSFFSLSLLLFCSVIDTPYTFMLFLVVAYSFLFYINKGSSAV